MRKIESIPTLFSNLRNKPEIKAPIILLVLSFMERAWLFSKYQPVAYSDTYGSYFRIATSMPIKGIGAYDGSRVPGYPLLIAILNLDEHWIWLVQLGIGLLITQLLFLICWKITRNSHMSFLVGLLYNLIPGQFLFESNLLSETFTTFLLLLAFLLLLLFMKENRPSQEVILAILLGITCSLPGMVRPLFFPVTIWFLFFVIFKDSGNLRRRFARTILFSLAPLLIQGGWIFNIYTRYGMLSPTTMGGYSLVQHTGAFFELLPDSESVIRDTYLEYRDARILERGTQTNTIWDAIPTLADVSGLNFFELSREMKMLSLQLIRAHPDLYLKSVVSGWITFWKAPVYWDPSRFSAISRGVFSVLVLFGRWTSIASNVLFLVLTFILIFYKRVRDILFKEKVISAIFGLIWITSILQTLVDHGDNPRFLVPLQMLVIFLVLLGFRTLIFPEKVEVRS